MTVGGTTFTWPLPQRLLTLFGRRLPVELVVVAGVYALTGLWLLWQIHDLIGALPDLVANGLFSDGLAFLFAYLGLFLLGMVLYVVVALLGVAYLLLRTDPVGRGLSAVVFLALVGVLIALRDNIPAFMVVLTVASGLCCAVLFLSPWCRRALAESPRRGGRPSAIVLSQTLIVAFFSLLTYVAVIGLPGFRLAGDLGAGFVIAELLMVAACVLAWIGNQRLRRRADRLGRMLVSIAVGVVFVGSLFGDLGSSMAFELVLFGGILVPLWLAPTGREWFGDRPLDLGTAP